MEDKKGIVEWFDPKLGYGFISTTDGAKDIFVHYSDIVNKGFKTLKKGQEVIFSTGLNKRGEPKAIEVVVVE